jgi:hypothetical protein
MKKTNRIETEGSTTKTENLNQVKYKIIENTCVAEGGEPYSDYYGHFPEVLKPHSLFLFTRKLHPLNEVIEIAENKMICPAFNFKLDVATAVLDFTDHYHYAIRVKNFPNYEHIYKLQNCFLTEGYAFIKKVNLPKSVSVTVFKRFSLTKLEEGIYLDEENENKAYIVTPRQINNKEFTEMLINLRNNNACPLFDAAIGTLIINTNTVNMVRIYSENIDTNLLRCAKQKFTAYIANQVHSIYQ